MWFKVRAALSALAGTLDDQIRAHFSYCILEYHPKSDGQTGLMERPVTSAHAGFGARLGSAIYLPAAPARLALLAPCEWNTPQDQHPHTLYTITLRH